jgi:hypothetical protein
MARDFEKPEDSDDRQLAWLLTSAHESLEMRREFASELAQRLDVEFAARNRASMNGAANPSRNGAATKAEVTQHDESVGLAERDPPYKPVHRRRRWLVAIATAASLLVVAAVVSDPPAWAAALRAIVNRIGELTSGARQDQAARDLAEEPGGDAAQPVSEIPTVLRPTHTVDVEVRSLEPVTAGQQVARIDAEPAVRPEPLHSIEADPDWQPFDEPLPPYELSQRVDAELAAVWQTNRIRPVGPATDTEFMRRVYLDLVGRIPSPSEVQEFLEDVSPNRREALVDRLLEHHDHATHLAAVWRGILLPPEADLSRLGGTVKFDEWLAERFAENRSYDQNVRELLLAEGRVAESGPLLFYAALRLNPEELAGRTSRAFLGVRMECAQCHDHFFDEISQKDFWSFAAFFARISRPRGKMEMTSPVLAVRDNQHGDVMIPETDEIVPPRLPQTAAAIADTVDGPSRREVLVDWLTSPNNGQFARATVNRVWAHLFGRGLVEPADDMRPDNPPIAPDVLETLSRDFAASKFELRRLLRSLVLTQTYQLASRSEDNDPARTLHFAQMNIKSFTAEQLYDCIAVATRQPATISGAAEQAGLQRFADSSRQAFIEQFRAPAGQVTDYHAGIPQALTLMHGGLIHNATDVATSGLLKSFAAPFFTDEQRIDTLFLSTLSRYPTDAEREMMLKAISAATTDKERQQALGDILWALLNSAEFTFNH